MASYIVVDGNRCRVTESLGYQAGYKAKYVMHNGVERVAVFRDGQWTWWGVQDRLGSVTIQEREKRLDC